MNFIAIIVRVLSHGLLPTAAGTVIAKQMDPSRLIRFIVAFPSGDSTAPMARMVVAKLIGMWRGMVVVDNSSRGATIIGTSIVTNAVPDSYSMGWAGASLLSTHN